MGLEAPLSTLTFQGHGQSQFDLKQTVSSVLLSTPSLRVLLPRKEVQPPALSLLPVSLMSLSVSSPQPLHHVPPTGASKPGRCWPL